MASSSSLMASQTLFLRNPSFLSPRNLTPLSLPCPPKHFPLRSLSLRSPPKHPLTFSPPTPKPSSLRVSASSSSNSTESPLTGSTRTITTIVALAVSVCKLLASKLSALALKLKGICTTPSPDEMASIQTLQDTLVCAVGPMFFAAVSDRPRGLNTPLTVVAAGMAKWLDIYSCVLLMRVLFSWFPNIPWDRQPLSAIRDLCDPYLGLFRHVIPPIFNALDISPILAFVVLGLLGSILRSSSVG